MKDFQAIGAGQHDVEHDHIGKPSRAGRTELHIVRHALGLDSRLRESVKRQLANARVVFHAVHHSLPPSLDENPYPIDYRTGGRVQARGGSPARREGRETDGEPRSSPRGRVAPCEARGDARREAIQPESPQPLSHACRSGGKSPTSRCARHRRPCARSTSRPSAARVDVSRRHPPCG